MKLLVTIAGLSMLMYTGSVKMNAASLDDAGSAEAVGYYNKAVQYKQVKNYSEAIKQMDLAVSEDPANVQYKKEQADLNYLKRDFFKAIPQFEDLVAKEKGNKVYLASLIEMTFLMRQFDKTIKYADLLGKKDVSESNDLSQWVGKTYYNQERYTKALEYFLPLSAKKQDAKLFYDIAQCYMELDQYKKSVEFYEKALTVRYDKTWENELALVYTTAGMDAKAVDRFRNVIAKSNSSNYSNYFNLGNTFFGMNQLDSALVYFKKAQEVNPDSYELLTMLMHTYYKKKDIRGAQAAIDDVLKANPDNANAYYLLGKLYFDNGSKDKGEKYFEKAFQLDPSLRSLKVEKIVMQ